MCNILVFLWGLTSWERFILFGGKALHLVQGHHGLKRCSYIIATRWHWGGMRHSVHYHLFLYHQHSTLLFYFVVVVLATHLLVVMEVRLALRVPPLDLVLASPFNRFLPILAHLLNLSYPSPLQPQFNPNHPSPLTHLSPSTLNWNLSLLKFMTNHHKQL